MTRDINAPAVRAGDCVMLDLGAEQLRVSRAAGADGHTLDIGVASIASTFFKHEPPTPLELENAIDVIEEKLETWRALFGAGLDLCTQDPHILDIARLAGIPLQARTVMSREVLEQTFNRLAAVVQGRPASVEGLPVDRLFAARLLLLREFMHHMKFAAITIHA